MHQSGWELRPGTEPNFRPAKLFAGAKWRCWAHWHSGLLESRSARRKRIGCRTLRDAGRTYCHGHKILNVVCMGLGLALNKVFFSLSSRRIETCIWTWKVKIKFWPQVTQAKMSGHVKLSSSGDRRRSMCISIDVSRLTKHKGMIHIALSRFGKKI